MTATTLTRPSTLTPATASRTRWWGARHDDRLPVDDHDRPDRLRRPADLAARLAAYDRDPALGRQRLPAAARGARRLRRPARRPARCASAPSANGARSLRLRLSSLRARAALLINAFDVASAARRWASSRRGARPPRTLARWPGDDGRRHAEHHHDISHKARATTPRSAAPTSGEPGLDDASATGKGGDISGRVPVVFLTLAETALAAVGPSAGASTVSPVVV